MQIQPFHRRCHVLRQGLLGTRSSATLFRWVRDGVIPAPHTITPGVSGWFADEIKAIQARIRGGDPTEEAPRG